MTYEQFKTLSAHAQYNLNQMLCIKAYYGLEFTTEEEMLVDYFKKYSEDYCNQQYKNHLEKCLQQ